MHTTYPQGDILLVADEFSDGWMRGLRLGDLEVCTCSYGNILFMQPHIHHNPLILLPPSASVDWFLSSKFRS